MMMRSDLFIILGGIAIAIVIIKRAIWNAVIMIGNDFRAVFEKLNSISEMLQILATGVGTLGRRLEEIEKRKADESDERTSEVPAKPAWEPACNHRTPQYGCPDCIGATHAIEAETWYSD